MGAVKYSWKKISPMVMSEPAGSEPLEVFRTGDGSDVIRECVRVAVQDLIEAEATVAVGAGRYARTESRVTHGNGAGRGC